MMIVKISLTTILTEQRIANRGKLQVLNIQIEPNLCSIVRTNSHNCLLLIANSLPLAPPRTHSIAANDQANQDLRMLLITD